MLQRAIEKLKKLVGSSAPLKKLIGSSAPEYRRSAICTWIAFSAAICAISIPLVFLMDEKQASVAPNFIVHVLMLSTLNLIVSAWSLIPIRYFQCPSDVIFQVLSVKLMTVFDSNLRTQSIFL